eukprot:tig00020909_g15330.t1
MEKKAAGERQHCSSGCGRPAAAVDLLEAVAASRRTHVALAALAAAIFILPTLVGVDDGGIVRAGFVGLLAGGLGALLLLRFLPVELLLGPQQAQQRARAGASDAKYRNEAGRRENGDPAGKPPRAKPRDGAARGGAEDDARAAEGGREVKGPDGKPVDEDEAWIQAVKQVVKFARAEAGRARLSAPGRSYNAAELRAAAARAVVVAARAAGREAQGLPPPAPPPIPAGGLVNVRHLNMHGDVAIKARRDRAPRDGGTGLASPPLPPPPGPVNGGSIAGTESPGRAPSESSDPMSEQLRDRRDSVASSAASVVARALSRQSSFTMEPAEPASFSQARVRAIQQDVHREIATATARLFAASGGASCPRCLSFPVNYFAKQKEEPEERRPVRPRSSSMPYTGAPQPLAYPPEPRVETVDEADPDCCVEEGECDGCDESKEGGECGGCGESKEGGECDGCGESKEGGGCGRRQGPAPPTPMHSPAVRDPGTRAFFGDDYPSPGASRVPPTPMHSPAVPEGGIQAFFAGGSCPSSPSPAPPNPSDGADAAASPSSSSGLAGIVLDPEGAGGRGGLFGRLAHSCAHGRPCAVPAPGA